MESLKNPRGLRFRPWQQKILSTMSCLNLCKDGRFWFWLWFWLYLLLLMLRLSLSSSSLLSPFFLLFCCYCSCCYGCCCFLIQMMMLRFIHSPVQTSATDPCPVSKVLRGQATCQPSAMSTNSNCSIIEQMAVPGCMHFFLPESDITFRSWLEHPPQCARGHQGMQALTLNTCGKACRYQGERARPALAVGFLSCLSNSWFRYVLFLLQLSLFLF